VSSSSQNPDANNVTLADQAAPVAALALLLLGHRDLPAPVFGVNDIFPTELVMSVHEKPGAFDVWLAAIAPEGVEVKSGVQSDGRTHFRQTVFPYAGATIKFTEYLTDAAAEGGDES
jgi:hypothetical protein